VSLYADRPTLCVKDISVGCCYLSKQSFYRTLLCDKISVKKPDPPEPPPAYITDGVSKQDTESLLELQKTCHLYPLIVELGLEGMNITEVTDQSETEDK